jgi:hypothetical protein|tara:strand:+ start:153 stop:422 length:270 start_codon:yes stop_codon:yes gene_type:complete
MGTDHSRVDHEVFHVGIVDKMLMHPFPDAFLGPTGKSFVDAIPFAVFAGQQSPLGSAASHPKDGFNEHSAFGFLSSVNIWALNEKIIYL